MQKRVYILAHIFSLVRYIFPIVFVLNVYFSWKQPTLSYLIGIILIVIYLLLRAVVRNQKIFFLSVSNFRGKYTDHYGEILKVLILTFICYRAKLLSFSMDVWGWSYWSLFIFSFIADLLFLIYSKRNELEIPASK